MICKIDHTLDGAIPRDLCVICSPRERQWVQGIAEATSRAVTDQALRYDRKVIRRLKTEVKAWRERIEAMERSRIDPRDIKKAQETLRKAETDLYMVL